MKKPWLVTPAAFLLCLSQGHGALIISDSFNTADSSDINQNLGTRQTGSIATKAWIERNDTSPTSTEAIQIVSNRLQVGGSSVSTEYTAEVGYNFGTLPALTSGGSFTISWDNISTASGSYGSFSLNSASATARPAVDATTDFGVLFMAAGTLSIREGTVESASLSPASKLGTYVLTVTTSSIAAANPFTVEMTIGGVTIDLNGVSPGTAFSGTWNSANLYMSLSSRNGLSTYDNFSVNSVPEPSALLLSALGGLGLLRRRR